MKGMNRAVKMTVIAIPVLVLAGGGYEYVTVHNHQQHCKSLDANYWATLNDGASNLVSSGGSSATTSFNLASQIQDKERAAGCSVSSLLGN